MQVGLSNFKAVTHMAGGHVCKGRAESITSTNNPPTPSAQCLQSPGVESHKYLENGICMVCWKGKNVNLFQMMFR